MELAFAVMLMVVAGLWVATLVASARGRWVLLKVQGRCSCRVWKDEFVVHEMSTWRGALFELPVECPDCRAPVVTDPPIVERFSKRGKPPYSRVQKE